MASRPTKKALQWSAIFGAITLFISFFRESDMFRFLDYYNWQGYYLTQILFMVLIITIAGLLIGALISGGIDIKEAVSLGREFATTVKAAQLSDSRTQQIAAEQLAVNATVEVNANQVQKIIPQIPLGREMRVTASSELRLELIKISGISKVNNIAIGALIFIMLILIALYYFL